MLVLFQDQCWQSCTSQLTLAVCVFSRDPSFLFAVKEHGFSSLKGGKPTVSFCRMAVLGQLEARGVMCFCMHTHVQEQINIQATGPRSRGLCQSGQHGPGGHPGCGHLGWAAHTPPPLQSGQGQGQGLGAGAGLTAGSSGFLGPTAARRHPWVAVGTSATGTGQSHPAQDSRGACTWGCAPPSQPQPQLWPQGTADLAAKHPPDGIARLELSTPSLQWHSCPLAHPRHPKTTREAQLQPPGRCRENLPLSGGGPPIFCLPPNKS